MSDPQAALSIFAEISVALAGFSGIVIAFGRRPVAALSPLEMRRLSNLFILSGLALFLSLLGVSLMHLALVDEGLLWRIGSGVIFILATPWLVWDVMRVRKLEQSEKAAVNPLLLVTFDSLALLMLLLQLANVVFISAAWPFFLALVLTIGGAFQQFVLLVRMSFSNEA